MLRAWNPQSALLTLFSALNCLMLIYQLLKYKFIKK